MTVPPAATVALLVRGVHNRRVRVEAEVARPQLAPRAEAVEAGGCRQVGAGGGRRWAERGPGRHQRARA